MADHVDYRSAPQFDSKYLGSWDIQGEMAAKITDITHEMVTGTNGDSKPCTVIHLEGFKKPMIANKTNMKAIAKATGTTMEDEIADGTHYIQLYVDRVAVAGELRPCIRVRDFEYKPVK